MHVSRPSLLRRSQRLNEKKNARFGAHAYLKMRRLRLKVWGYTTWAAPFSIGVKSRLTFSNRVIGQVGFLRLTTIPETEE